MTTDDLLVDNGSAFDPLLVRLIDDEPEWPPFVEIQHVGDNICVVVQAGSVPELIRVLRGLVPAEHDPDEGGPDGDQPAAHPEAG